MEADPEYDICPASLVLGAIQGGIHSTGKELQTCTYFSAAVLQQDVDVLLVLEVVVEVHYVFVVQ